MSLTIIHREFEPPQELQDAIRCFWYGKIEFGEELFEVVPDGYAEIIFHFGSGCSISVNGVLQPLPSPFMIGLLNQPVYFYSQGNLEIIAIRCYPWAVFDLLGLQSNTNGVHNFEHPVASLQSALGEFIIAGKIDKAIDLVKLHYLNAPETTDIILAKAGTAMTNANGTLAVSEIANAAHATVRTLERKFRQSSGHTVKDVSGLMRFEQARNKLWHDPKTSLAALAYELGYTDQSHLSREFKRYSGTTPAAFARKAKKGQQDVTNNFITFVS